MTLLERKVDAIAQALLASDAGEERLALDELRVLMGRKTERFEDVEEAVRAALLELGVPDNLTGHPLLISAVTMAVKEPKLLDHLSKGLYPEVAMAFDSTIGRVERNIRHAIAISWERIDADVMRVYFGSTVSPLKDKPTNGEFLARVSNVVRKRMKGGA